MRSTFFSSPPRLGIIAGALWLVCACGASPRAAEDPLEGTAWVLESVSIEGASREAIPEAQVTASFSDGELAGDTGCNRYSLSYSVDGSELHRGALLLTGAACDSSAIVAQEDVYIAALERIEEFSVSEERLELRDSAREVLIVFVPSGADLAE